MLNLAIIPWSSLIVVNIEVWDSIALAESLHPECYVKDVSLYTNAIIGSVYDPDTDTFSYTPPEY